MTDHTAFLKWLTDDCGYLHPRVINEKQYAAIQPLMFTCAVITGNLGDKCSTDQRWCFHDYPSALIALETWAENKYESEPEGWHRHLPSGRRRNTDGEEYIAP